MFNQKKLVLGLMVALALGGVTQVARADDGLKVSGQAQVKSGFLGLWHKDDDRRNDDRDDDRDERKFSGLVGTISAVNGTTLTVQSKGHMMMGNNNTPSAPTYTVDAGGAKVMKDNATTTLSALAVGDMVLIEGTVNGTNVVATSIRAGMNKPMDKNWDDKKIPFIQGNGQPVTAGKVTAINTASTSLTISNKSGVTYTVSGVNATIYKNHATSTFGSIAVNDSVVVQGTFSGNNVTAAVIVDQGVNAGMMNDDNRPVMMGGWFHGLGVFFSRLFGF